MYLRHIARTLYTLTIAAVLTSCATSVVTPEQETDAGAAMQQQVADQIGLYMAPELERYLDNVGQRLVDALGETPYSFQFAVVDQFEPNAFASPGGFIYVSRGLLAQMNSEAELAGVLAHEISHVTQRHHTKQAGRGLGAGLLTLPGRAVGVVSQDLGNMINAPINYAGKVYLSSFSRGQETEADAYGMRLAAAAGYDPLELVNALQGIERVVYLMTGEHHEATFFDTHPTTPQRVSDIKNLSAQVNFTPVVPLANTEQFYGHLDGMWWGPQNPQQGVFDGQVFRSADLGLSVTFPADWETINTPRFVGAAEPEQGAYLALGSNEGEFSPEGYGAAFITRMRDQAGLEPAVSRSFNIGDWPAHVVRYDDDSSEEVISLFYVFVATDSGSYTFMSMGLERFREALRESVLSLSPLTESDRKKIGGIRLRTAELRQGEQLEAWSTRLGSAWGPVFSAAMNGLPEEGHSGSGELLKYARKEQYRPN
jgi:predicted Zn-dependent protease